MKKLSVLIVCITILLSCQRKWHLAEVDPEVYRFNRYLNVATHDGIDSLIAPYKLQLDEEMNEEIGYIASELLKERPESTLGNFVSDALVPISAAEFTMDVDFGVQNYGGMRVSSIPVGPITNGKVFELMPFDNLLVVISAKGAVVKKLFDRIADSGGWPISSAVSFSIDNEKAVDILINGEPLDAEKTYAFALPDYVANGGDKCDFLISEERVSSTLMIRDAIIQYVKLQTAKGDSIYINLENRINLTDE